MKHTEIKEIDVSDENTSSISFANTTPKASNTANNSSNSLISNFSSNNSQVRPKSPRTAAR